jgi:hypothetical protein
MDMKIPEFIDAAKVRVDGLIKWRDHIEKALARNGTLFSYTDVCQLVLAGKMAWFENEDSFAVVEPLTHINGNTFSIIVAGGKYDRLLEVEQQIVNLAKSVGVKRLTTLGRDGFLRRKRPEGWNPTHQQFFVKEV